MEQTIVDIFNSNAFGLVQISQAIDLVPIKWGRLGELNAFPEAGVITTQVALEYRANRLTMLPMKPRGTAGTAGEVGKRTGRIYAVPHIPHTDKITADDIQGIRAFGMLTPESLMGVTNRKLLTIANKHDITLEHMRAGMLQGKLLDFDGTAIFNLFTDFGINEPTIDFDFANATDESIITAIDKIKAQIEDGLQGDVHSNIRAMCGPTFWRKFLSNATVLKAYQLYQAQIASPNPLRDDVRKGFVFQDIIWEQYRANASYENADGTFTNGAFIPATDCRFYPEGTLQTMATYFGPPTFLEGLNQPGLKRYAKVVPEPANRWIDIITESNPLPICMKPAVLVRGKSSGGGTNI